MYSKLYRLKGWPESYVCQQDLINRKFGGIFFFFSFQGLRLFYLLVIFWGICAFYSILSETLKIFNCIYLLCLLGHLSNYYLICLCLLGYLFFLLFSQINHKRYFLGGARDVMVIVVGNGHEDISSNPGRDIAFHIALILPPAMGK